MALRVEIDKKLLEHTLDLAIASNKRAINTSKRPEFAVVYEQELQRLNTARTSITEIK